MQLYMRNLKFDWMISHLIKICFFFFFFFNFKPLIKELEKGRVHGCGVLGRR